MNKLESRTWFLISIIFMLAFFGALYKEDYLNSRVKELETENEMLREKAKPTLRMYNQPKCNCSCVK